MDSSISFPSMLTQQIGQTDLAMPLMSTTKDSNSRLNFLRLCLVRFEWLWMLDARPFRVACKAALLSSCAWLLMMLTPICWKVSFSAIIRTSKTLEHCSMRELG